jgi:hypothetical protein
MAKEKLVRPMEQQYLTRGGVDRDGRPILIYQGNKHVDAGGNPVLPTKGEFTAIMYVDVAKIGGGGGGSGGGGEGGGGLSPL